MKRAIQIITAAAIAVFIAWLLGSGATAQATPPPPPQHAASVPTPANPLPLFYFCTWPPCKDLQEFTVFDGNRWPIFTIGEAGGASVLGDNFSISVYKGPLDPFHTMIQLRKDGTILVNGQILTANDLKFIHCIEKYPLWYCRAR